jgi:hypothetical protein
MLQEPNNWKEVDSEFANRVKKLIKDILNPRKPWWWILVILAVVVLIMLIVNYLPMFWPQNFKESRLEYEISPGVTVFYPPRVVVGYTYPITFIHTLSTSPAKYPVTITYILTTDWQGGGRFVEPELVFVHQNIAPLPIDTTLDLEMAKPPSKQLEVEIKDRKNKILGEVPIDIYKIPDVVTWIIFPLAVSGATIGKAIYMLIVYLLEKCNKKPVIQIDK